MAKKTLRLIAVLALAGILLYFSFRSVNWGEAWRAMTKVNWPLLILVIPLFAHIFVTRAIRWRYLLRPEKEGIRFANLFAATAVGFAVSFVLPGRVGEVVRPLYLARKEGIRPGYAIGTIVVERVFDMLTMCALLAIFLLARPLYAGRLAVSAEAFDRLLFWGKVGAAAAVAILALIVTLYFFKDRALAFFGRLLRRTPEKFSAKVLTLLREFIEGLKFFHSLASLGVYLLLSVMVWLGIAFYYWVFFLAFRVPAAYVLVVPYVFLTGVGASIPTPGMIGGFEFFSNLGLTLLFGLDASRASGITIATHAHQVLVTYLLGYAILAKEGLTLFQIRRLGETKTP
ncbi:MAG: flippase-like domain-containing protein [Candidatus Aminicenantes bacterium]|nr:flippase-like domain-containing protein [Candidatus Aminicenantes bacterium]